VLFLDEPTVGLDPTIRHELWSLIGDMRARDGMTLVLTTHYLEEAERLCERLAIMDKGRVVETGTHAELMRSGGLYSRLYGMQAAEREMGEVVPFPVAGA